MKTIRQNVRFTLRLLWKNPGFTLAAIITSLSASGANTAIFSVLYASLLAPMPYPDADRLVMVWSKIDGRNVVSAGDFIEWKRQNKTFQDLVAWSGGNYNLATPEQPEMVSGRIVSPGYYRMQGLDFFSVAISYRKRALRARTMSSFLPTRLGNVLVLIETLSANNFA